MGDIIKVIFISVILLIQVPLIGQSDFIEKFESMRQFFRNYHIYGSKNHDLSDPDNSCVRFSYRTLKEYNTSISFTNINAYPNIKGLMIDREGLFNRDTSRFEIPQFSDLEYIKIVEFYDRGPNCNYNELFQQFVQMPSLEYLIFPYTGSRQDIDESIFSSLLAKLKGIKIEGGGIMLPHQQVEIKELVLFQNSKQVVENLKALNLNSITHLNIKTDTLNPEILNYLSRCSNIEHLILHTHANQYKGSIIEELSKLKSLVKLDLNVVNENDFNELKALDRLRELTIKIDSMQSNDIKSVFELPALEKLKIHCNRCKNLDWSQTQYTGLKELEISSSLNQISFRIGELNNLRTLDLSSNKLEQLPSSIGQLKKLKTLDLKYNSLKYLANEIVELASLENLELNGNDLIELPSKLGDLKKLKILNASNNAIIGVPISIKKCRDIEELNLCSNQISEIPIEIYRLSKLQKLNLAANRIQSLPDGISALVDLKELRLEKLRYLGYKDTILPTQNDIASIPPDLYKLKNLETVDFSNNPKIGNSVLEQFFKSRSTGMKLRLSECGITKVPENGWDKLNLISLDLSNNNISIIPENFYSSTISDIALYNNPLGLLNTSIKSKTNLLVLGYLNGFVTRDQIIQQSDIVETIMEIASRNNYYTGRINPILELYPIAFELDSVKASILIDHGNYAQALFEAKEYAKSIPHFTIDINKDKKNCVSFVNLMAPKIYNRHIAFLNVGDTLSAIKDLELLDKKLNINTSSEIAILYLNIGDQENFIENIDNCEKQYYKKKTLDQLDKLSILELYLLKLDGEKFRSLYNELSTEIDTKDINYFLLEYLNLIFDLTDTNSASDPDVFIQEYVDSKINNQIWGCHLIKNWNNINTFSNKLIIEKLNNIICPN